MRTPRRVRLSSATSLLRQVALWLFAGLWLGASATAGPQHANQPAIGGPQAATLPVPSSLTTSATSARRVSMRCLFRGR